MSNNIVETVVGGIVVCIAALLLAIGYLTTSSGSGGAGTPYNVVFDSIDGIANNSDVKIGGVGVGKITSIQLSESFKVVVTLTVRKDIKIPEDSLVEICSAGFFGDKYISISPGQSQTYLSEGDTFVCSKGCLSLEQILNKVIAVFASKN
jgi:phospholipid/cholesterol/gamma-HCH transport system substrate-binding protein